MNLLRKLLADRRKEEKEVRDDRRGKGPIKRWKDSGDRLDRVVDDLYKTVKVGREDFCRQMQEEGDCPVLVDNHIARELKFDTFAEICEFRYSPENSLMRLCKNPKHEAHASGIAPCQQGLCPKLKDLK